MRSVILTEIKRLAEANGKPPGVDVFTRETGIAQSRWYGVFWARWSEALIEAGFAPNTLQPKYEGQDVLRKVAAAAKLKGSLPTTPEMKILRRSDPSFPNPKTISSHFGNRAALIEALRSFCLANGEFLDVLTLLPEAAEARAVTASAPEGWVYLLKSGQHFKIGRSDTIERRLKEISIALPEATTLVHAIRTDDPSGIETYWHRRFSERRANGEWFKLDGRDVSAFCRRKFQ